MPAPDAAAITAARLQLFAPRCDYLIIAPLLDREAARCGIDSARRRCSWLAQLHHESLGFTKLEENLNYSAERLCQVWPTRFPSLAAAAPYARNPPALANKVYGGRMGNVRPGDGWRFRGRGFNGLTGHDNYVLGGNWTGLDLVGDPDQASRPDVAAKIAADFWRTHNLNPAADAGDDDAVTRAFNGGLIGLDDRVKLRRLAATIWRG